MNVNIKRIDKSIPLPKYESSGAVGFDIIARIETVVKPKEIKLIPSNNIVEIPEGYVLILAPRSSMPIKTGLSFPHSIGVIDQDFCGDEDEVMIQVYNYTNKSVVIKKGMKIAQGIFVRVDLAEWNEVETHNKPTRGAFGSTG